MQNKEPNRLVNYGQQALVYSLAIFVGLLSVYLLTYGGIFVMVDEWYHASWARDLALNMPAKFSYIAHSKSLVQAFYRSLRLPYLLPMALLFKLSQHVSFLGSVHAMGLANIPATALTAVFVFLSGMELKYKPKTSAIVALVYGLGTPAWFYSKVYLREPFAAMLIMGGLYFLIRFRMKKSLTSLALAAVFLLLATVTRRSMSIVLFWGGVYAVATFAISLWSHKSVGGGSSRLRRYALVGLTVASSALFLLAGYFLTKIILRSYWGYLKSPTFFLDLWGYYGNALLVLLISPARGIVTYFPAILISVAGAYLFAKKHPLEAMVIYLSFLPYLLALTHYCCYWGGWGWMSRYVIPFLPFFVFPMISAVDDVFRNKTGGLARWSFYVLLGLSFSIQILGAMTLGPHTLSKIDPQNPATALDWHFAPFIWQFINRHTIDPNVALVFLESAPLKLFLLGAYLLIVVAVVWTAKAFTRHNIGVTKSVFVFLVLTIVLAVLSVLSMKEYYFHDSRFRASTGFLQAIDHVKHMAPTRNDALLEDFWIEQEYGYFNANARLMEYCKGGCPKTSTVAREEWKKKSEKEKEDFISNMVPSGGRLWFIPTGLPEKSPYSVVEQWLDTHAFPNGCKWTGRDTRLCLYYLPAPEPSIMPMAQNVRFGEHMVLKEISLVGGNISERKILTRAGKTLLIKATWRPTASIDKDYKVTLQVIDITGKVVAQLDREPVCGFKPTNSWHVGETITDNYAFNLPAKLVPGDYRFILAVYDSKDRQRLNISGTGNNFRDLPMVSIEK